MVDTDWRLNQRQRSNRRQFIRGVGAAGVIGLAGCAGDDGNNNDGNGSGDGGNDGDSDSGATGNSGGDEVVELDYWTLFGGGDGKAMKQMVETFNEEHDNIQINRERIEWSQYYGKLFTALTGGTPPDICIVHTTRMLKYNDAVIDLNPYLSDGVSDAYIQSIWDKTEVEGKRSGLPLDVHPTGFYYNKDIFSEAGLDPESPPGNWEEFKAACDAISDAGYVAFNPQPYAGPSHLRTWFQWHRQRGGQLLNEDRTAAAFDTDAGIELAETWAKMTGEWGWDDPDASGDRGTQLFRTGEAGMINQGTWYIGALEDVEYEWGMFKPFTAPGKQQGAAWTNSHTLAVPRKSDRSDAKTQAAVTAIEWLTQKTKDWVEIAGHLPASVAVNEDPALRETDRWDKTIGTFFEMARDDQLAYLPRHQKIEEYKRPIFKNLQQVYSQQKDPEQAIRDAAEEVNSVL